MLVVNFEMKSKSKHNKESRNNDGSGILDEFRRALYNPDNSVLRKVLTKTNVDSIIMGGTTALHMVCCQADVQKAEILLENGADPCFVSRKKTSFVLFFHSFFIVFYLHFLAMHLETTLMGIAKSQKNDELSTKCCEVILKWVKEDRKDELVNAKEKLQWTALMAATNKNKVKLIQCLLDNGARIDETDSRGRTALHYAVSNRNVVTCRLLIEHGADPTKAANDGTTPLNKAEKMGSSLIVDILQTKVSNESESTSGKVDNLNDARVVDDECAESVDSGVDKDKEVATEGVPVKIAIEDILRPSSRENGIINESSVSQTKGLASSVVENVPLATPEEHLPEVNSENSPMAKVQSPDSAPKSPTKNMAVSSLKERGMAIQEEAGGKIQCEPVSARYFFNISIAHLVNF